MHSSIYLCPIRRRKVFTKFAIITFLSSWFQAMTVCRNCEYLYCSVLPFGTLNGILLVVADLATMSSLYFFTDYLSLYWLIVLVQEAEVKKPYSVLRAQIACSCLAFTTCSYSAKVTKHSEYGIVFRLEHGTSKS